MPLYGCCIPLAGERCARDYARRRISERSRRKAALSAEITQEGIHRRLRPNSGYCVSAVWEPSSKQARLIRHRRRFAYFPALLKSLVFRTFIKVLKTCSARRKDFFDTLRRRALPVSLFVRQGPRSASRAARTHGTLTPPSNLSYSDKRRKPNLAAFR